MTLANLDRRLRAIEARRSGAPAVYLAWGRTPAQAQAALAHAIKAGAITGRDEAVALVWPDPGPVPASRWVVLGDNTLAAIGNRELEILVAAYEAAAIASEREAATAKGEDVSALDDTDLRVRIIRREGGNVVGNLRWLAIRANPSPGADTGSTENHRRYEARQRAWLARYLPGECLFA